MHRIITTAASLALLATGLSAQIIYAPDNDATSGACNSFPFGQTESRYQTIINARYFPQRPVKITGLSFAPCNSARFTASHMQVRMCHTTLTDFTNASVFDRNMPSSATVLHDGPTGWGAVGDRWSPLSTPCDFGYEGQGNLLIEVRFRGGSNGTSCHRGSTLPRLWSNGRGAYAAASGSTDASGLKLRLEYTSDCVLNAPDTVGLGQRLTLNVTGAPAGTNVQMAASLGQTPTTILGHTLCLAPDTVFFASLQVGAPVFNDYAGVTNRVGGYTARFVPPVMRSLVGLDVYHAGVAYNRTILCATNTVGSRIVP